jgi:hypothetical protein
MYAEDFTGESFLDALDQAADARDRSKVAKLAVVAFERKDLRWQAAARHADNYIVALQRGNKALQETCLDAFAKLVPLIRAGDETLDTTTTKV